MSATFIPVIKFYKSPIVVPLPTIVIDDEEDESDFEVVDISNDDEIVQIDSDVESEEESDDEIVQIKSDDDSEDDINYESFHKIRNIKNVEVLVRRLNFVQNSQFLVKSIFRREPLVRIKNLRLSIKQQNGKYPSNILEEPLELLSNGENVIFHEDSEIPFITDVRSYNKSQVTRLETSLTFLKPSQSEENYGLGCRSEMEKDDVDCPRKVIPFWAQNENLTELLLDQQFLDCDRIFGPCESPDLKSIFSGSKRIYFETPQPVEKTKKRRVKFEESDKENNPIKKSRNLLPAFCA